MKLTESTLNSTKRVLAERAVQKYFKEGLNKDQIQAKLIEEGFLDKVKGFTGLGMTDRNKQIKEKIRSTYSVFMEFMDEHMPTSKELGITIIRAERAGSERTRGLGGRGVASFEDMPRKKRATLQGDRAVNKRISKMEDFILDATSELSRKDKTSDKVRKFANALIRELEAMDSVLRNFRKEMLRAERTGETEGAKELQKQLAAAERARAKAAKFAFAKQQADIEKDDRERRRQAKNRAANEPEDIIRGKSTERFGLGTKGAFG